MRPARVIVLVLLLLSACRGRESDAHTSAGRSAPGNVEAPIPAGETMRISTTDRVFDLALRNDSVVLSLSGHTLSQVHKALDSVAADTGKNTIVGSFLTRKLMSGAEKLATKTTGFPLHDLESATYQNGRIDFRLSDGKAPFLRFDQIKQKGRPVMEAFSPADAERFVRAVRAAKNSG
jgi:hypothetical protein